MVYNKDKSFWVLQDSGNANELYKLHPNGQITHTLQIVNQKNNDWDRKSVV